MERRNLLKSALASAAIAAPAMLPGCFLSPAAASIRKAAPFIPSDQEAELIEIGREVEALTAVWLPIWQESDRLHVLWAESVRNKRLDHMSREELDASLAAVGYDKALAANEAMVDRLDLLAARAWEIAPSTPAGLAALAKVARWDCLKPSDLLPDAEPDHDAKQLLKLFVAIEAVAQAGDAT